MKLTKQEFCEAVDTYQRIFEESLEISDALGVVEWKPDGWIDAYYNLLTQMCELDQDEIGETDLDYYCYELEFGRKWKPYSITIDGVDMPCRNSEELWNLITYEA